MVHFYCNILKFLFQKMKPSISSPIKAIWKKNWIDEFDPDVNCFSKKKKCYFAIREQETKLQLLRYWMLIILRCVLHNLRFLSVELRKERSHFEKVSSSCNRWTIPSFYENRLFSRFALWSAYIICIVLVCFPFNIFFKSYHRLVWIFSSIFPTLFSRCSQG